MARNFSRSMALRRALFRMNLNFLVLVSESHSLLISPASPFTERKGLAGETTRSTTKNGKPCNESLMQLKDNSIQGDQGSKWFANN